MQFLWEIHGAQAAGNGARNNRGGQFTLRRQQPGGTRQGPLAATVLGLVKLAVNLGAYIVAPVVQFFFKCVFQNLAFFLYHQNFGQASCELAGVLPVQGPDTAHFK